MNQKIVFIFTLSAGLFVGSMVGYTKGYSRATEINKSYIGQVERDVVEETLKNNPPPQCFNNDCPEYDFFDVDGDGLTESIVTERTTMTQGGGVIWIIDNGRVVFKSDRRMQIAVAPRDKTGNQSNGFIILYATETQLSPTFLDSFKSDYYAYEDGKYVLEKTIDRSIGKGYSGTP